MNKKLKSITYLFLGVFLFQASILPVGSAQEYMAPSDVENIKAVPGDKKIILSWDAASDDDGVILGYRVYYGTNSVQMEDDFYTADILTGESDTTFAIEGLQNGVTYYFSVTAIDDEENESDNYSLEVSGTPKQPKDSPTLLSASQISLTEILVKMSKPIMVKSLTESFSVNQIGGYEDEIEVITTKLNGSEAILLVGEEALIPDSMYKVTATSSVEDLLGEPVNSGVTDSAGFKSLYFELPQVVQAESVPLNIETENVSAEISNPEIGNPEAALAVEETSNPETAGLPEIDIPQVEIIPAEMTIPEIETEVVVEEVPSDNASAESPEERVEEMSESAGFLALKEKLEQLEKLEPVSSANSELHESAPELENEADLNESVLENVANASNSESSNSDEIVSEKITESSVMQEVKNLKLDTKRIDSEGYVLISWNLALDESITDQILYLKVDGGGWDEGFSLGKETNEVEIDVDENKDYEIKLVTVGSEMQESDGKILAFSTHLTESGPGTVVAFGIAIMTSMLLILARRRVA